MIDCQLDVAFLRGKLTMLFPVVRIRVNGPRLVASYIARCSALYVALLTSASAFGQRFDETD